MRQSYKIKSAGDTEFFKRFALPFPRSLLQNRKKRSTIWLERPILAAFGEI